MRFTALNDVGHEGEYKRGGSRNTHCSAEGKKRGKRSIVI